MRGITFEGLAKSIQSCTNQSYAQTENEVRKFLKDFGSQEWRVVMSDRTYVSIGSIPRLVAFPVIKTLKTGKKRYTYEIIPS